MSIFNFVADLNLLISIVLIAAWDILRGLCFGLAGFVILVVNSLLEDRPGLQFMFWLFLLFLANAGIRYLCLSIAN
jgi:hypothetical protein